MIISYFIALLISSVSLISAVFIYTFHEIEQAKMSTAMQPLPLLGTPVFTYGAKVKTDTHHIETTKPLNEGRATEDLEKWKDVETVALVVKEPKAEFDLVPVILDEVRSDEVLIEMKYSGICKTNISYAFVVLNNIV